MNDTNDAYLGVQQTGVVKKIELQKDQKPKPKPQPGIPGGIPVTDMFFGLVLADYFFG